MGSFLVNGFLIALAVLIWPVWLVGQWLRRVSDMIQSDPEEASDSSRNLAAFSGLCMMVAFLTLVFTLALEPLLTGSGRGWVALGLASFIGLIVLFSSTKSKPE